ncbi:Ger(x)C family spore germination protein [Paenibacillus glycanilyticus]|uniref:Ger(x)C family spore germination protein n=1 Tax=Paenibacillus glycanilyticus TaxID=126569 RepID=UPI00203EEB80|nr:Ger(x)C family spore germination protein [Paenibacillus glycanilyticus]MCM3629082.1 Ger(x)C family spore germination protein [Paenibacillus glycanilyticus]
MRTIHSIAIILLCLFLLTGCWDKSELVEFGYVQAVAFDKTKAGKLKLTTLFFKPTGGSEGSEAGKQSGPRSFTIQSEAYTVFEAIRDISLHFGRKAKWDHMRVILINEKVLQQRDIGDIMDFFARDHEPRGTALVLATKGEAADYLKVKPIIESTLGEQLRSLEIAATRYSAKSIHSSLLDLSIQLHSEVGIALLPYIQLSKKTEELSASGISIIKGGKQVSSLSPTKVQQLLMLTNQFKEGSIEIPCGKGNDKVKDGLEVLSAKTKTATFIQKDSLTVKFNTKITGTVSEMHCSSIVTREDESAFKERIRKAVEQEFLDLIDELQTKRLDAIGIGNKIFAKHPAVWKRWRENWDERFDLATFECHVEIQLLHTGVNVGKPYSEYKEK